MRGGNYVSLRHVMLCSINQTAGCDLQQVGTRKGFIEILTGLQHILLLDTAQMNFIHSTYKCIITSVAQTLPVEAGNPSAGEISRLLWNQDVHYRVNKILPLQPILDQRKHSHRLFL
jgi:hypothetical protein